MDYDYIECGDCFALMDQIENESIDMILCDLPYGTTQNAWDKKLDFGALWAQYNRIAKPNAPIVLFTQQPFTSEVIASQKKLFRYEWIWVKNNATGHLNAKRMPRKKHENILVFYKKLPIYNPQGLTRLETPIVRKGHKGGGASRNGTNYGKSDKDTVQYYAGYPTDILEFPVQTNAIHPTQKPVLLLEYLIRTYTNEGGVVLDNAMGVGSTCVAAVKSNRHYIGFEINESYYGMACKRLDDAEWKGIYV